MKIIISPAKRFKHFDNRKTDNILFEEKTRALVERIQKLSLNEIGNLNQTNDELTEKAYFDYKEFDFNHLDNPALFSYDGLVFKQFSMGDFPDLEYLNDHVYILDAFYGLLKPMTGISDYRLYFDNTMYDLYEFWGDDLYKKLFEDGDLIDPVNGNIIKKSDIQAKGITGTGVIAAFSLGSDDKIIKDGKIKNTIYLQDGVYLKEKDISNIGKALGAFRAGQITLAESADILLDEIESVYMAGASGFYVDAKKSLNIGQIPPGPPQVYQIGNTSLAMAKDIVLNPELLGELQKLADKIESNHIMLATSEIFEKIYSLELAIYEQGMPFWMYNQWLQKYGIQEIPNIETEPEITKLYQRDIADLGENDLNTVDIENTLSAKFDRCIYCMECVDSCPENALSFEKDEFKLRTDLCSGLGCLRCAGNCKEHAFKYEEFYKDI